MGEMGVWNPLVLEVWSTRFAQIRREYVRVGTLQSSLKLQSKHRLERSKKLPRKKLLRNLRVIPRIFPHITAFMCLRPTWSSPGHLPTCLILATPLIKNTWEPCLLSLLVNAIN